jgi:hypothetical protein
LLLIAMRCQFTIVGIFGLTYRASMRDSEQRHDFKFVFRQVRFVPVSELKKASRACRLQCPITSGRKRALGRDWWKPNTANRDCPLVNT